MSFVTPIMGAASGFLGAGGLVSGIGSLIAGNSQAKAYRDAMNQANGILDQTRQQNRSDWSPYVSSGTQALDAATKQILGGTGIGAQFTMGDFYNDPGYQFTLQQGTNALNNQAASKGMQLSGATLKGLAGYTTGLANQTYNDAYNRNLQNRQLGTSQLMGLVNVGQNATQQMTDAGLQIGRQKADTTFNGITGAANARAAGITGLTNGIGGGMSSIGKYYAELSDSPYYPPNTAAVKPEKPSKRKE